MLAVHGDGPNQGVGQGTLGSQKTQRHGGLMSVRCIKADAKMKVHDQNDSRMIDI